MGPAKKGMNPVIPILIVVVLVAAGVGAFFLLSGDDESSGPEGVVEELVSAASDRDCEAAVGTFSNASIEQAGIPREQLVSSCESSQDDSGLLAPGVELVSTEVSNETDTSATVEATIRSNDEETSQTLQVVQEDGEWRIDLTSLSGGGAEPPEPPDDGGGDTTTTESDTSDTTESDDGGGSTSGAAPPEVLAEAEDQREIDLANDCGAGDMAACDQLWPITPSGSTIEAWSESCGGRDPGGNHTGTCVSDGIG